MLWGRRRRRRPTKREIKEWMKRILFSWNLDTNAGRFSLASAGCIVADVLLALAAVDVEGSYEDGKARFVCIHTLKRALNRVSLNREVVSALCDGLQKEVVR